MHCLREDGAEVLNAWMDALRQDPVCQPASLVDELSVRSVPVLEELAAAFEGGPVDLSADHFRGAVRELSFVGGWLAGRDATASLAVKYVALLGQVLRPRLAPDPADWDVWRALEREVLALTLETFCRSLRADARQRRQEMLAQCTPVLRLPGELPALVIVGAPSRATLSSLCGRLLLEVARLGARALCVDFTHATELPPACWDVLVELLNHRKIAGRERVLCATPAELARHLRGALDDATQVRFEPSWDGWIAGS